MIGDEHRNRCAGVTRDAVEARRERQVAVHDDDAREPDLTSPGAADVCRSVEGSGIVEAGHAVRSTEAHDLGCAGHDGDIAVTGGRDHGCCHPFCERDACVGIEHLGDDPVDPDLGGHRGMAADLLAVARLDFRAPDEARFPALRIAREAGPLGPRATAALIAADDVAVARFLEGSVDFPGIPRLLEAAVARFGAGAGADPDLDELVALDAEVRAAVVSMPWGVPA